MAPRPRKGAEPPPKGPTEGPGAGDPAPEVQFEPGAQELAEFVYEAYRGSLGLGALEGGGGYHAFLDAPCDRLSTLKRIQAFHIVKFGYPLRRAGYTVAVFGGRMSTTDSRSRPAGAYYAYAYWPRGAEAPEYICLGPTYDSRDGEYRHRFLWYPQFREGWDCLREQLAPYEELLLAAMGADELLLDVHVFPDTAEHVYPFLDGGRLGLEALSAVLALDGRQVLSGVLDTHATAAYSALLRALCGRDLPLFADQDPAGDELGRQFAVFQAGAEGEPYRPQCGQKLTPLTVREALLVGDAALAPWREAWVGQRAADLVVNGAAPGFALYGNWTYLDGAGAALFENPPMRQKYARSLQVEGVVQSLRAARKQARPDATPGGFRLQQLDSRLYEALLYAQDFLVLTDLALCAVTEYVGRTASSTAAMAAISARQRIRQSPAVRRIFADPGLSVRYLFDFCYGAHALHTRAGAIHSDLHTNNLTFFEHRNLYECGPEGKYRRHFPEARIAYVAGPRGEAETYVFPHDGWYGCIIDFSRSLLGPAARPALAAEKGEPGAARFYAEQAGRSLRVLEAYAPHFAKKNQVRLRSLFLSAPDRTFRAMSAVDFLALGQNYGALLRRVAAQGDLEVCPQAVACADAVKRHALEHLIGRFSDLLEAADGGPPPEVPYAGEALLPAVFGDRLFPRLQGDGALRGAELLEVFSLASPAQYSGTDGRGPWPPWGSLDELGAHLGGLPLAAVTADRGGRPFLEAQGPEAYLGVLQEAVRRAHADAPGAPGSSWLSTDRT